MVVFSSKTAAGWAAVLQLPVLALGLAVGSTGLEPALVVDIHSEVGGGDLDRNPPRDPKLELRIGNVGRGPLYLHSLKIFLDEKKVDDERDLCPENSHSAVSSFSRGLFQIYTHPAVWVGGRTLSILTLRPKEDQVKGKDWADEAAQTLKTVRIEYVASSSNSFLLRWLTMRKKNASL